VPCGTSNGGITWHVVGLRTTEYGPRHPANPRQKRILPRTLLLPHTRSVAVQGPDTRQVQDHRASRQRRFGTVYLAQDTWIDKKVAIKVPHRQGLDFGELLREPRLLASVSHPNIVSITTAEKQDNLFFIVMEYVQGETLENLIAGQGPLDVNRSLDFTCQICNAVDHAHRQGVIHRDLRPANVLVTENDMAKVADFGTSRFLEIAAHGTTVIGSPPYMAPEQFPRQGGLRLRPLLARRDDVSDDDRDPAVRRAGAGGSRSADVR
jgi:serine/threonine protein kinase